MYSLSYVFIFVTSNTGSRLRTHTFALPLSNVFTCGRSWDDRGPQWVNTEGKRDGFVSTLTQAVSILPEGKPLWGGPCHKTKIEEVDLCPVDDQKDPEEWENEIGKAGMGGAYIFSDGSLLGSGNVGGVSVHSRLKGGGGRGGKCNRQCGNNVRW